MGDDLPGLRLQRGVEDEQRDVAVLERALCPSFVAVAGDGRVVVADDHDDALVVEPRLPECLDEPFDAPVYKLRDDQVVHYISIRNVGLTERTPERCLHGIVARVGHDLSIERLAELLKNRQRACEEDTVRLGALAPLVHAFVQTVESVAARGGILIPEGLVVAGQRDRRISQFFQRFRQRGIGIQSVCA